MSGGGPFSSSSEAAVGGCRRPPPGAGILEWLEDEENVERRERWELQQRAMESDILHAEHVEHTPKEAEAKLVMRISGTNCEAKVMICN